MKADTPDTPVQWIAHVLRWGAYGSALLLAGGLAWLLLEPDIPMQIGPPMPLASLPSQLAAGNPYAFLQLGLLALLATPPLSTLLGGVGFARSGEKKNAAFALTLLLALALSLFLHFPG